jgi:hypothetical protein
VSQSVKRCVSFKGITEDSKRYNAKNNIPKYIVISPAILNLEDFENSHIKKPMTNGTMAYLLTLKAINWLEKVVPILAPITMPITCLKFKVPAFIKIIAMIMTAEDESNKIVATVPIAIDKNRLSV